MEAGGKGHLLQSVHHLVSCIDGLVSVHLAHVRDLGNHLSRGGVGNLWVKIIFTISFCSYIIRISLHTSKVFPDAAPTQAPSTKAFSRRREDMMQAEIIFFALPIYNGQNTDRRGTCKGKDRSRTKYLITARNG